VTIEDLLRLYIFRGGHEPDFWRQTPRTLQIFFEAKAKAAEQEQEQRAWLAWHMAALPMMKKFPKYQDFVGVRQIAGADAG